MTWVGMSDHAIEIHRVREIPTVIRRADVIDVSFREATRWRRGVITFTTRGGHLVDVPLRRGDNFHVKRMYEELAQQV